ncbi:hypothetical protein J5J83_21985 [Azoarcus sp. L1K30]|uniref:hypothetical protein n=1 Tax=Azoarcus sp. L1K30 TaxID=2820277 RepID=UPI001B827F47|nr:hypothetical protein [Azoarcus sp. L1K30]MBR0568804.1 hypothetical protein [Azoarcus sp. L1K30]
MKKIALAIATALTATVAHSAVVISPTTLTTTEDGATAQYKVVLDSPPNAGETVTVTPASGDFTEGTVSAPVQFTAANYSTPQYVTVTPGASGDGNDGDVSYTITNTISSSGGAYAAGPAADTTVTNSNVDGVAMVIVDPSSGFWITEGSTRIITFKTGADVTPGGGNDVTINLTNNTPGQVTLSANSVILSAGNGYSATVTISAIDDTVIDGDQAFSITTAATLSGDAAFNGVNPLDIEGFAGDNDVAAVAPVPTLGEWARIALVLMLMGIGGRAFLRRHQG